MTVIREIMCKRVFTIRPEASLAEAVKLLTEHHIGGAPVVSAAGELVGMISELSLIDVVFDMAVRSASISEYMTRDVQMVGPEEPLSRAAQLFALYSFRRLPVVENGRLVGIVTRRDLMNHALASDEPLTEPLIDLIPSLAELTV
jgi:CBS domain-containing protein